MRLPLAIAAAGALIMGFGLPAFAQRAGGFQQMRVLEHMPLLEHTDRSDAASKPAGSATRR